MPANWTIKHSPRSRSEPSTVFKAVKVRNRCLKSSAYPDPPFTIGSPSTAIYFGDEAGTRSDYHSGTTWGVRGKIPIVSSAGTRFSPNLISAVIRPYSPELNPDEYVWNDLKNQSFGKTPHSSSQQMNKTALSHKRIIQKTPSLVISFFRALSTIYASWRIYYYALPNYT